MKREGNWIVLGGELMSEKKDENLTFTTADSGSLHIENALSCGLKGFCTNSGGCKAEKWRCSHLEDGDNLYCHILAEYQDKVCIGLCGECVNMTVRLWAKSLGCVKVDKNQDSSEMSPV